MIAQAATAIKSLDPKKVAAEVRKGKPYQTALGDLKYDKKGDVMGPAYVVYTWKNFKAIAGDHLGTATSAWGKFSLEGCMVAYGGDPSSQSPGEGEGGKMDFLGADIRLRFDPNYLQNIRNSFPANPVFLRVAWNQR